MKLSIIVVVILLLQGISSDALCQNFAGNNQTICSGEYAEIGTISNDCFYWSPSDFLTSNPTASIQYLIPLATTTYHVTVVDNEGDIVGTDSVTITVEHLNIIPDSASICIGETLVLTATSGFANYFWTDENGLPLLSNGGNMVGVVSPGTYYVSVNTANGCELVDSSFLEICDVELECEDGIDNDGDGLVDCEDEDCKERPVVLDTFNLDVYSDSVLVVFDTTLLINAAPEMPNLGVLVTGGSPCAQADVRVEIRYQRECDRTPGCSTTLRDRNDSLIVDWFTIGMNELIEIDFGNQIMGGRTKVVIRDGGYEHDSLWFNIKGENPEVCEILDSLSTPNYSDYWFMPAMAVHERGTGSDTLMHQFNPYNASYENLLSDWNAFSRCPTRGCPCGWGVFQLDIPAPISQALWSWRINMYEARSVVLVKRGATIDYIEDAVADIINWNILNPSDTVRHIPDRIEGNYTFRHTGSDLFQGTGILGWETVFPGLPSNSNFPSFLDGDIIKRFNGGLYMVYNESAGVGLRPYWTIDPGTRNYVNRICSTTVPTCL